MINTKKLSLSQKFVLKPISPVHIGTGEDVDRAEIAIEKNICYRASLKKLYRNIDYKLIDDLITRAIERPTEEHLQLEKYVKENYDYRITISKDAEKTLQYFETIKTNSRIYIPGSSIKGSILTAVINKAVDSTIKESYEYKNAIEKIITKEISLRDIFRQQFLIKLGLMYIKWGMKLTKIFPDPMMIYNNKSEKFKGNNKVRKDNSQYDQWIQVTDTETGSIKKNGYVRRVRRAGAQTEGQLPDINMETIHFKDQEFAFQMKMDSNESELKLDEILTIADEYYREMFKLEQEWFRKKNIPIFKPVDEEGYLLRIGHGTGHSTLSIYNTLKKNYSEDVLKKYGQNYKVTKSLNPEPTTKLLAEKEKSMYRLPLGWVIIKKVNAKIDLIL